MIRGTASKRRTPRFPPALEWLVLIGNLPDNLPVRFGHSRRSVIGGYGAAARSIADIRKPASTNVNSAAIEGVFTTLSGPTRSHTSEGRLQGMAATMPVEAAGK